MKFLAPLLIAICFLFFNPAGAFETGAPKTVGFDLGMGFFSNFGIVGVGTRYFLSDSRDVNFNAGVDSGGLLIGLGSRLYSSEKANICLFIFKCNSRYFIGGNLIGSSVSTVTVNSDGAIGNYQQTNGYAGNLTVGSYDIFKNSFTMGFELGYRVWMKRPEFSFQSGTFLQKHKNVLDKFGENSFNFAITGGWLF